MKSFMEEYGKIVVAAIVVMIFAVVASPIGNGLRDGVTKVASTLTNNVKEGFNKAEGESTITDIAVDFSQYPNSFAMYVGTGSDVVIKESTSDFSYAIIPVEEGQTYHIVGTHAGGSNCYILADENKKATRTDSMGADTTSVTPIREVFTVERGEAYLYVNSYEFESLKKIENFSVSAFPLMDKKIVFAGDSIVANLDYDSLTNITLASYQNYGIGGARLTTGDSNSTSVVDRLENLPKDGDLYCFEGGINDYWGNVPIGTYSTTDFTGELDTTTICGSLEYIFRYCKTNFPDKPVCFVITHKIMNTAYRENTQGDTFEDYRDTMVAICEKYDVAYYDAFSDSELDGSNEAHLERYFLLDASGKPDGIHPNAEGYKKFYLQQLTSLFKSQF